MKHTLTLALVSLTITSSHIHTGTQEALLAAASFGCGVAIAGLRQNAHYKTPEQVHIITKNFSAAHNNKSLTKRAFTDEDLRQFLQLVNGAQGSTKRTSEDFWWATARHTIGVGSVLGIFYCASKAGSFDSGSSMNRLFTSLSLACSFSAAFSYAITTIVGRTLDGDNFNYWYPETWNPKKKALVTAAITGGVLGAAFLFPK